VEDDPEIANDRHILIGVHAKTWGWMPARRPEITVAYLTTQGRFSRAEVELTAAGDGVEKDCAVNLDSINTVPKDWLTDYVCTLSAVKMREVKVAVLYALDLR
jgi:mRNA-degrading endonuclease toxin of MazEF toxin-antitoxin module